MPTLSKHYAKVVLPNGDEVSPISVSVTADESWSPYIQATVVLPTIYVTDDIDPRTGSRIVIKLRQDFGDLIYIYELTEDFGGSVSAVTAAYTPVKVLDITRTYSKPWNIFEGGLPISTVTAAYGGDVSALTAAGLSTVWLMSKFLQDEGTFNPAPSTIFEADLGVRAISYDYVTKEATITLASDEALTQDVYGYGDDVTTSYGTLRELLNEVLSFIGATLQPGAADYTYSPSYQLQKYELNVSSSAWDFMETVTQAAGLKIYCDEQRRWYLVDPAAVSGNIDLKDDDNITAFTKEISRDGLYYNQAIIQYETISDGIIWDNYYESGTGAIRTLFQRKTNIEFPGFGAAESLVQRSLTRGETYSVEAIANFDGRPRQTLTVDISGEPVKSGIVQSITWALPSARMSLDIRDLIEV